MRLRSARARRATVAGGVTVACLAALVGCGGDDATSTQPSISPTLLSAPPAALVSTSTSDAPGGGETVSSAPAPTSTAASSSSATSVTSATSAPASTTGGSVSTGVQPAPTIPPSSTGVPGGTSDIALCRNYATVVGSQNVLTVAGAFGNLDTAALARLELIAAPAMVAAAEELGADWPAELAGEQSLVGQAVLAPILDRAEVARLAVDAAGIDESLLVTAWQATLAAYDPGTPTITVTGLAPNVEAPLATAASTYAATSLRYDMDPTLIRTAATPLTSAYLFDHCPELSYLIAGDAD